MPNLLPRLLPTAPSRPRPRLQTTPLPTNPDTINNNVNNNSPLIVRDNRLYAPHSEWTSVSSSGWMPKLRLGPTTTTQSGPIYPGNSEWIHARSRAYSKSGPDGPCLPPT
ncbi:hypothetical protein FOVG_19780 [Fusarium oxysporum f. sp. pisi HDV247]|uniref:Uncharacterized protein n=1 Tax=Fusarium oxysporum f. sp. pisi HDV247 TaxID=1080344 RepID=W9N7A4_FUSOX|nr:hypothetical protein FOVG_19780 [Fusarium oxysporum f. sp. pisi HDV247]